MNINKMHCGCLYKPCPFLHQKTQINKKPKRQQFQH